MEDKKEALTKEEWSKYCQIGLLERIKKDIDRDMVTCWSKELLRLTSIGEHCCEIGCGTGQTSAYLAKYGRIITAIDYSEDSLILLNELAKCIGCKINTKCIDATEEMPFRKNEFDTIFHCGLLEHFEKQERISMLKNWRNYTKRMISMVPNAASLPYRIGKKILEDAGKWGYGLEIPQSSMIDEFITAGYSDIQEYTIGTEHALRFLPQEHYLRDVFVKLLEEGYNLDDMWQGYLLVTIGISSS